MITGSRILYAYYKSEFYIPLVGECVSACAYSLLLSRVDVTENIDLTS